MTLDEFYADPARRESKEISFGFGWRSSHSPNSEFVVFWIESTGELCLLETPLVDLESDQVVSRFVLGVPPHTNPHRFRDQEISIRILGSFSEAEVDQIMAGWQDHLRSAAGIEWIRGRLESRSA